jgi:hypothetical protein
MMSFICSCRNKNQPTGLLLTPPPSSMVREISDDNKTWDVRTDRMTFEVQKGNTTVRSLWTNSVRNDFQKQAGWANLQEVRATAAK